MNAVALTQELVRIDTINPTSPERPCAERVGRQLEEASPIGVGGETQRRYARIIGADDLASIDLDSCPRSDGRCE